MASGATSPSSGAIPLAQLRATAAGFLVETGDPDLYATQVAPSTQVVYGVLLGLHQGTTVTGVVLRLFTAAAGTLPTTARFGIADSTGKVLAISGNLNSLAQWAGPINTYAFTAPLVVPKDDGYYACFVVNGTWSVTQPTIIRGQNNVATPVTGGIGTGAPVTFSWSAQTDLPAVNSSLTLTTGITQGFWMAFY